jgi:hypothetical protein
MFDIGTRVWNHRFGAGTVTGRLSYLVCIRFDSGVHSNESPHYLKVIH